MMGPQASCRSRQACYKTTTLTKGAHTITAFHKVQWDRTPGRKYYQIIRHCLRRFAHVSLRARGKHVSLYRLHPPEQDRRAQHHFEFLESEQLLNDSVIECRFVSCCLVTRLSVGRGCVGDDDEVLLRAVARKDGVFLIHISRGTVVNQRIELREHGLGFVRAGPGHHFVRAEDGVGERRCQRRRDRTVARVIGKEIKSYVVGR